MSHMTRHLTLEVLLAVLEQGQSLDKALAMYLPKLEDVREQRLLQALSYGVLRRLPFLKALLKPLLKKPLKAKDQDMYYLLCLGVYQHLETRIPAHAATATTVEVARLRKKAWATGLINAILRNFVRQKDSLLAEAEKQDSARFAHPPWWLKQTQKDWAEHWQQLLDGNNEHPPLSLRVNALQTDRDSYLAALEQAEIAAKASAYSPDGIVLDKPVDVLRLPDFAQGAVAVQDSSTQFAAQLLKPQVGERVLDACAAPGGKTAHLLAQAKIDLLALDISEQRLAQVEENCQRLQCECQTQVGDASTDTWWDGKPFDAILADVPCSASGVVRRHPDIKYRRRINDIAQFAEQQGQILENLWQMLKPGGRLLYSTCSIFAAENQQQIQQFLAKQADAELVSLDVNWGIDTDFGRQILPGESLELDGFFYSLLHKQG